MAYSVKEDLIDESMFSHDVTGMKTTRKWIVDGLTPGPGMGYEAFYVAVDPVTGQKAAGYGTPHPRIGGIAVTKAYTKPFPQSKTKLFAISEYGIASFSGNNTGYTVNITGTTGTKTLALDAAGKPLKVYYDDKSTDPPKRYEDYVRSPQFTPGTVIEFAWQTRKNPYLLAKYMRGKISSDPFQGEPPHAWMCRKFDVSMQGTYAGNGRLSSVFMYYNCTAAFELDVTANGVLTGWERIEVFQNTINGQIPTDIDPSKNPPAAVAGTMVTGNGFGIICPKEAVFGDIGLPDITGN